MKTSRIQQHVLEDPGTIKELTQDINGNIHTTISLPLDNKSVEGNWRDIKTSLRNGRVQELVKPRVKKGKTIPLGTYVDEV